MQLAPRDLCQVQLARHLLVLLPEFPGEGPFRGEVPFGRSLGLEDGLALDLGLGFGV